MQVAIATRITYYLSTEKVKTIMHLNTYVYYFKIFNPRGHSGIQYKLKIKGVVSKIIGYYISIGTLLTNIVFLSML